MKSYPQPHKKLTEYEVKELVRLLEENHNIMKNCFSAYLECHSNYIEKLNKHFFPERFSICEVTTGDLNEMMEKCYGGFSSVSETRRMNKKKQKNET